MTTGKKRRVSNGITVSKWWQNFHKTYLILEEDVMSLEVSVYLCRKIETQEKKMSDDRSFRFSLCQFFYTHKHWLDCISPFETSWKHCPVTGKNREPKDRWCNDWTVLTMRGGSGACRVTMGTLGGRTLSDTLLTDMLYRPFSRSFWTEYVEYIFNMQQEEKSLESLIYPEVCYLLYHFQTMFDFCALFSLPNWSGHNYFHLRCCLGL